jgi:enoyl-CoA hydratase/carnithine racemase
MSEPLIKTELIDGGIFVITFNRPAKKNAFLQVAWPELTAALKHARSNDDIKVAIITGAGDDFTTGVDLGDFADEPGEKPKFEVMLEELMEFDKPLLAAARGAAIGFGATVLFHCDVVYVGESLKMRLPFVNLGLVPEAACSYTLQSIIGRQASAELLFTAEWIDAKKALQYDLCREIVADDALLEHTINKAREIAQWPVNALRETKRCLMIHHQESMAKAHKREMEGMVKQAGSPENIEAITAFLEKRPPDFSKT